MAIIDLRGPGSIPDSITRLGAAAASVITSIKGPDAKNRRAFFRRIEEEPELFNEFGKIARDNPGALQQMFPFLKDEDIEEFRATLPSLQDLEDAVARPPLTPVAKGGTLTPETGTALGESLRAERAGLTAAELALVPKEVIAAGAIPQADVTAGLRRDITGLTPGQSSQDKFNAEIFNTAFKAFENLGLEEKQLAALRDKLPSVFRDADVQQLFTQRLKLAQMQIDAANIDRVRERVDASERAIAARWVATTNVGVPETWQQFLFDIESNKRAKALDSGEIEVEGEADVRLMEVAIAFKRGDQVDKIVQESAIDVQIRAILTRIGAVDRDGEFANTRSVRQSLTEMLNRKYVEISLLTDNRVPIRIGEIPKAFFGEGNRSLVIRDELGEEIDPSPQRLEELRIQESQDIEEAVRQSVEFGESAVEEEAATLNFETVDVSQLSTNDRDNLIRLVNGEGTMEELLRDAPLSAQRILDARRNNR